MEKSKFKKIFAWLAVAIWMAVIFGFSSMKGSGEHYFDWFYFIERKGFHVIEYFILCSLLGFAFAQNIAVKKSIWLSMALALIYAASDEWHQTFVFGREGVLRDVVIDFTGIVSAAVIMLKFKKYVFSDTRENLEN